MTRREEEYMVKRVLNTDISARRGLPKTIRKGTHRSDMNIMGLTSDEVMDRAA